MQNTLRWGFICTARINDRLMKPIRASKNHKLAAVSSRNIDKARAYAGQHHFEKAYGSYEELLADPDIDVIYNSLPNHLHAEWTIKACQAGKHVLCEKPIALSIAEIDAIEAAARKAGVVVQEAFMYRHHPQTLKIQELLDQKVLGKITMARGIFTFFLRDPEDVRMRPEWGGGSLWDVGVYPISYMRTMLRTEPESVFGWQMTGTTGVDISFSGELMFPGNVLGQFQSAFNCDYHMSAEILGEKGSLYIPVPFSPYTDSEFTLVRQGKPEKIKIKGQDLYLGEVDNMADCIFRGKSPRVTLEDSRNNTRVLLTCIESARTGNVIAVK
jgi:D-xylose 1-dehydrogenase (NADP+, D-xylono-1,5-lactone-forming)